MDVPTKQELPLEEFATAIQSVTGRSPGPLEDQEVELVALGVTSLHFFRLIALLEEQTGVTFEDGHIEPDRVRRLADVRELLSGYGVVLQHPAS